MTSAQNRKRPKGPFIFGAFGFIVLFIVLAIPRAMRTELREWLVPIMALIIMGVGLLTWILAIGLRFGRRKNERDIQPQPASR